MAMYFRPRDLAAAAISSMLAVPSVQVLCMCRSPRMSPSSISSGSSRRRPIRTPAGPRAARAENRAGPSAA